MSDGPDRSPTPEDERLLGWVEETGLLEAGICDVYRADVRAGRRPPGSVASFLLEQDRITREALAALLQKSLKHPPSDRSGPTRSPLVSVSLLFVLLLLVGTGYWIGRLAPSPEEGTGVRSESGERVARRRRRGGRKEGRPSPKREKPDEDRDPGGTDETRTTEVSESQESGPGSSTPSETPTSENGVEESEPLHLRKKAAERSRAIGRRRRLARIEACLRAGRHDEARRRIEAALVGCDEAELPRLLALLDRAKKEARSADRRWRLVEARIRREWEKRAEWLARGKEIEALAGLLEADSWSLRGYATVTLGQMADRRAIGRLARSLRDASTHVRLFALLVLETRDAADLRACENVRELVGALIDGLGHSRQTDERTVTLLETLSGETASSKREWSRWWTENRNRFEPEIQRPYDLSRFSAEDRKRYAALHGDPTRTTTTRLESFRVGIEKLREKGIDMAVCLDVTGSMRAVLHEAKKNLVVAGSLFADLIENVRIGFCTYRDRVRRVVPLTKNWAACRRVIARERAGSGGDPEEGVDKALYRALRFKWRDEAEKSILLVGDAPPHTRDLPAFRKLVKRAGARKTKIHVLLAGRIGRVDPLRKAAEATGGKVLYLRRLVRRRGPIPRGGGFIRNLILLGFGETVDDRLEAFVDVYIKAVTILESLPK